MTEDQQEELLIRIDERTETICQWIGEHKEQHKSDKTNVRAYLLVVYSALVGLIVKAFFWG